MPLLSKILNVPTIIMKIDLIWKQRQRYEVTTADVILFLRKACEGNAHVWNTGRCQLYCVLNCPCSFFYWCMFGLYIIYADLDLGLWLSKFWLLFRKLAQKLYDNVYFTQQVAVITGESKETVSCNADVCHNRKTVENRGLHRFAACSLRYPHHLRTSILVNVARTVSSV